MDKARHVNSEGYIQTQKDTIMLSYVWMLAVNI